MRPDIDRLASESVEPLFSGMYSSADISEILNFDRDNDLIAIFEDPKSRETAYDSR